MVDIVRKYGPTQGTLMPNASPPLKPGDFELVSAIFTAGGMWDKVPPGTCWSALGNERYGPHRLCVLRRVGDPPLTNAQKADLVRAFNTQQGTAPGDERSVDVFDG